MTSRSRPGHGRGGRAAACLAGLLAASAATADEPRDAAPRVGELVRVDFVREVPGARYPIRRVLQRSGVLVACDTTGLRLERKSPLRPQDPPEAIQLSFASLERVRVRDGRSGGRGAMNGLTWGLLTGSVMGAVGAAFQRTEPDDSAARWLWMLPAGAGTGMLVGAGMGADVWRDYPVSRLMRDSNPGARP